MNFHRDALSTYESPVCEIYSVESQGMVCDSPNNIEPGGGKEELGFD